MAKSKKKENSVLEDYLLTGSVWQEGFKSFLPLFPKPTVWLFACRKAGASKLVLLDRKGSFSAPKTVKAKDQNERQFLKKYFRQLIEDQSLISKEPSYFKTSKGKLGVKYPIYHLGRLKGFLIMLNFTGAQNRVKLQVDPLIDPFKHFLIAQVELAYKNFELDNFYETVHPRALALSTMHSVHRVISASLRLKDLLPRVGRLSAQILKAQGCSIMLVDSDGEHLIPSFAFGEHKRFIHRQRLIVGRGIEGRIAQTGQFCLNKRYIGVPFIDSDVVGLIMLWDKVDGECFSQTDLEILKTLSEQAVVAIKNAQLYEQTEALTLGSIKTINELLERQFGSDRGYLVIMGELVLEIGRLMRLTGDEILKMERAIMLLDTGHLATPEKTWKKKGRLTKKEFAAMKKIPSEGVNLLRSITSLKPVIPIILHRHERYDGKGYPRGLKEGEIPLGARIVSVVDSFVAMLSRRNYRNPMTVTGALSEIQRNAGTQFDPDVVDAFLQVMEDRAILSKVEDVAKDLRSKGT